MTDVLRELEDIPQLTQEPADSRPAERSGGPPHTSFALRDLMREFQGKVYANWVDSFTAACIDTFDNRFLEKASIISIKNDGRCSVSNRVVVRCQHRG